MNWLTAHKNCAVIPTNVLPHLTMPGSPSYLPTSPLLSVMLFSFQWLWPMASDYSFWLSLTLSCHPLQPSAMPHSSLLLVSPFSDLSFTSSLHAHHPFPTRASNNTKINCSLHTCILHNFLLWTGMLMHPPAWFRLQRHGFFTGSTLY